MEEKLTMDDFKEELEASYKAAEESGAQDSEELDPVWATLQQYMDDKEVLNVKIGGVVNAGVIAYVDGVRGFIPASRLSLDHVDDLNEWLNKKIRVRVITVDPEKKRLVLSAREILRDEARAYEALWHFRAAGAGADSHPPCKGHCSDGRRHADRAVPGRRSADRL